MALISLDHVSKVYPKGTRPALDDVTVHVDRGDFVFLVGASGSGKTTLLSLLLHEEEATDGEIRVAGNDLRRLANSQVPQYRRSIGFVFQDYKLLNNKTVWQNVAFALEVIGTSRSTISSLVPKVLETVGLVGKESNYPHELSGGEAQRVAIARAYVNHPQILLADEPTGNLDPTTSLGIMEVLEAINRTGTTIVMATHNEEIVNSMRKRVVELHNGKIVRDQKHGSYDSALFFPDSETESKSKAQQVVATSAPTVTGVGAIEAVEAASNMPEHDASTFQAMNAVVEAMHDDSEDDGGIARLAKSVHSGRKGRYGETFKSVETTMTWGRGLDVDEIAAQGDVDVPPAQGDDAPENDTPEQGEQQGADSMPPVPPAPPTPPAQQMHDSAQSGDAESAQVDGADAATDDGDAASEHAETENAAPLNAVSQNAVSQNTVPQNADAADGSGQETETIHHEEQ
ncbi:MAG: cell division ATP-binding protein FtsE [Bifidobacterium tibiigranuli]|jgi:cell division transport system ATP-binding protein|uniref:cell division ATP-binding protein FtsE n=1 Tax=Bifidobacterium tibiigranuli TaxID=2172043 RepID=UPI0026EEFD4E|nr:cell division ATP-binding protein FtsE [Bifidobacterium tibiigranuli]MCI1672712.1 cell division ATP-binding protein FtsE [Bifidobacterium tibiigranuli]MCI1712283.1 cell division ATP-binding protein FtsE [Bifidobacterium tibiigranuli]MCI1833281.1 cell division ATP-binding protein FtsE [Bifidobacterium tibiigranuli]